jgi:hypothetical protein
VTYYRRKPIEPALANPPATTAQAGSGVAIQSRFGSPSASRRLGSTREAFEAVSVASRLNPISEKSPGVDTIEEAAKLLGMAASILDEETATGILAARSIEGERAEVAGIGPGRVRDEALWRDLHDLVDAVAGAMPRILDQMPSSRVIAKSDESDTVPEIRCSEATKPGQKARVMFKVRNDEATPKRFAPMCTELLGPNGGRIPAEHVVFSVHGVTLEPGKQIEVTATINVPSSCSSGVHTGLVVAPGIAYLRALIVIEVA